MLSPHTAHSRLCLWFVFDAFQQTGSITTEDRGSWRVQSKSCVSDFTQMCFCKRKLWQIARCSWSITFSAESKTITKLKAECVCVCVLMCEMMLQHIPLSVTLFALSPSSLPSLLLPVLCSSPFLSSCCFIRFPDHSFLSSLSILCTLMCALTLSQQRQAPCSLFIFLFVSHIMWFSRSVYFSCLSFQRMYYHSSQEPDFWGTIYLKLYVLAYINLLRGSCRDVWCLLLFLFTGTSHE